mmetsp:Transcript_20207/g.65279  ORF Transcript_20207/g.65279 Transcript_20207/m.65279 type:complete len:200 (+) Transcript_20207:272-871(+)
MASTGMVSPEAASSLWATCCRCSSDRARQNRPRGRPRPRAAPRRRRAAPPPRAARRWPRQRGGAPRGPCRRRHTRGAARAAAGQSAQAISCGWNSQHKGARVASLRKFHAVCASSQSTQSEVFFNDFTNWSTYLCGCSSNVAATNPSSRRMCLSPTMTACLSSAMSSADGPEVGMPAYSDLSVPTAAADSDRSARMRRR